MPELEQRLRLWQALLWVLTGGLAAQLAGSMCAAMVHALLTSRGVPSATIESSPLLVLPAMAAASLCLAAFAAAAPLLSGVPVKRALGLVRADGRVFVAAAVGTLALNPLGDLLMRAMESLFPDATFGVMGLLTEVALGSAWFLVWPIFALLPGVAEELMFRGLLQRAAGRGIFAIVLSAVAFAAFHADPHHIAGVLPLGFFLSWVASRAGTLVTIVAHVANNSMAIVSIHSELLAVGYGTEQPMPWQWVPIGIAVSAVCALVIVRLTRRQEPLNSTAVPCSSPSHVEHRSQ